MNAIVNEISLDLKRPGKTPVIHAVQGEQGSRSVVLSLFCEEAVWEVPEDAFVAVRYSKPDQTGGYYDTLPDGTKAWSCEGSVVTLQLAPQLLASAGAVFAQLEILQGEKLLATFSFCIMVEANPAAGLIQSETYVNWLQWMTKELEKRTVEIIENGEFTGPMGPAPSVVSQVTEYQASDNADTVPEGEWYAAVPEVPGGGYLWARTTIRFETGEAAVYGVTRYGVKGQDGVTPVVGVDYFTEEDKLDIVNMVMAALPAAEGVSY